MSFALDNVRQIAERVAASHGVEVWDIEMRGSGKTRMLRIYIDKPEGVTHEDCANFSREVSTIFDVEEAVSGGAYLLEISSPGLDRKLLRACDWTRFQGSLVKLSTYEPIDGNRHFEGRLVSFENDRATLELGETASKKKQKQQGTGRIEIAYSNIEKANLVPEI